MPDLQGLAGGIEAISRTATQRVGLYHYTNGTISAGATIAPSTTKTQCG